MRFVYRFAANFVVPVLIILCGGNGLAQERGITPRDCVAVKYIEGVWMSWSGKRVAYLVKAPNIAQNRNEYQLYVREVDDRSLSPGALLFTGAEISDLKWLRDDSRIAMLLPGDSGKKLVFLNTITGVLEPSIDTPNNIEEYSIDSTGNTLVYRAAEMGKQRSDVSGPTPEEIASGYRIKFGEKATDGFPMSTLYIRRHETSGTWSAAQALTIENPFTHVRTSLLPFAHGISLSPNGRRLLLSYLSTKVPDEWMNDPVVKRQPATTDSLFEIMVLYDLDNSSTKLAFQSVAPASTPLWSNDSTSFFVNASSPIGSRWEAEDIQDHRASPADGNLFLQNVDSGEVEEVLRNVPDHREPPLFLQEDGDVIVRASSTSIVHLHHLKDSWHESERTKIAQKDEDRFLYLVSNGREILGTHETVSTPRDLFVYDPRQGQARLLTDLNPQLAKIKLAPVEVVHWTTADNLNVNGLLFMPPNYSPGTRYPLVIETKGDDGEFTCDSGFNDDPSFAPQPLATAGIMYLVRTRDETWKYQEEIDKRPKGYPGGIGEAVQQMDIWDSAVDALDKIGMIDPSKVGIIGFSRTGWYVEFDLIHSHIRYAAATVADNVQYSLSDYWLIPWASAEGEQMYGGPPYGDTLANWQKYSISFNLDKIHTPMLMEEMGYGTRDDNQLLIPLNLAVRYEVSRGLARLGKPVEMYFYPDEVHQPEHPKARLASVQRNVDWYRFWLQGYERPTPEDPDQYKRWEHLRELRDADAKTKEPTRGDAVAPN